MGHTLTTWFEKVQGVARMWEVTLPPLLLVVVDFSCSAAMSHEDM